MPFTEGQGVDHPLQFYAATKRANELMAHAYSHLYRLPTTGLRFFTVYGPWGRPDMAPMLFASAILEGRPIKVYGHGRAEPRLHLHRRHRRGGDPRQRPRRRPRSRLGPGATRTRRPPTPPSASTTSATTPPSASPTSSPSSRPPSGKPAIRELLPMQPGDVRDTYADSTRLARAVELAPGDADRDGGGALRGLVPRLLRRGRPRPTDATAHGAAPRAVSDETPDKVGSRAPARYSGSYQPRRIP